MSGEAVTQCPKCGEASGNDWSCGSACPMPMNPRRSQTPTPIAEDELVHKLRRRYFRDGWDESQGSTSELCLSDDDGAEPDPLCREAATRIQSDAATIAKLQGGLQAKEDGLQVRDNRIAKLDATIAGLRASLQATAEAAATHLNAKIAADATIADLTGRLAEAEARVGRLREALEQIAASKYGLQGVQEDHGNDTNAYNYHAMQYFSRLAHGYRGIAMAALANAPAKEASDAAE